MAGSIFERPEFKRTIERVREKRKNRQQQESVGSGGRRRQRAIDDEIDRMINGQSTDAQNSKY